MNRLIVSVSRTYLCQSHVKSITSHTAGDWHYGLVCVCAGEEEPLRLPVGHGGAGVRSPDGWRLHHHRVGKQHEQQRLRHRHAARQPLQRPVLSEVSDSTFSREGNRLQLTVILMMMNHLSFSLGRLLLCCVGSTNAIGSFKKSLPPDSLNRKQINMKKQTALSVTVVTDGWKLFVSVSCLCCTVTWVHDEA